MNNDRTIAIVAGTLLIVATASSLLGNALTKSILESPNVLSGVVSNESRVIVGALASFVAAATSAGIAISLYPVLKEYDEGLAIGAVGFRLIEGVFYAVGTLCLLSLVPLGHQFVGAGSQDAPTFGLIGHLLLAAKDLAGFVLGVLAFYLGASMYYWVLYRSNLIPRWLSAWGLLAMLAMLAGALLTLFDGEPYSVSGNVLYLALPIAVQEMVMAVWLIVKGFNSSDRAAEPMRQTLARSAG